MHTPFDKIATTYDETFTKSKIGKLQRNIVHKYLDKALLNKGTLNILEVNCGTGEDAVWFANKGHTVLATDVSEEMLSVTEKKVLQNNLGDKIKTRSLDLNSFEETNLGEKFDLIFSNFGGINCIDSSTLNRLSSILSSLLNNRGRLLLVIMPRYCLWESLYFLAKLNFKKIFRRNSNKPIAVNLGNGTVKTYYYSTKDISEPFSNNFQNIRSVPVGFFLPPGYLNPFFEKKSRLLKFLVNLERVASRLPILSNYSDHFLIDMEIKS